MKTPYDGRFKLLAEEFPNLLLRMLGIVEPGCSAEPIDILRELHLDPVHADHAYRIGAQRLVHFEAITRWHPTRVPRLALYRFLMKQKFQLPVDSYLVLMAEKYAPQALPGRIIYAEDDGFRIETPYQVIRLWHIDPRIAFEPGCEALLPWVPLLKGGAREFEQAAVAIEKLASDPGHAPYPVAAMAGNLAALAALRYDRDEIRLLLESLREKLRMTSDIFTETWLYQDGKAEGKAEGEATGKLKGTLEAKREDLRTVFQLRFPTSEIPVPIHQITDIAALDTAFRQVIQAATAEDAAAAIRNAFQPPA